MTTHPERPSIQVIRTWHPARSHGVRGENPMRPSKLFHPDDQDQRAEENDERSARDPHPDTQRALDELLRILLDEEVCSTS